ncbi:MAG: signal peptidase I [Acidimicrobiales bacterium]
MRTEARRVAGGSVVAGDPGALSGVDRPDDRDRAVRERRAAAPRRGAAQWGPRLVVAFALMVVAVVAVVVVVMLVASPIYSIPSGSMEPTLRPGDWVLVDKVGFHASSLRQGDVVVFKDPAYVDIPSSAANPLYQRYRQSFTPATQVLIKRVIGLPGQTIQVTRHGVKIDGRLLSEPYVHTSSEGKPFGPYVVPRGSYFVMGDNRTHSYDSRELPGHAIPAKLILGRAVAVIWPPSQTRVLRP